VKTPVIALHGFLGRASDWNNVRAASRADVVWTCPDLFTRGASSFAPPDVGAPCWLAGYSFGARLALHWMQDQPDRWLGALLVSANPGNFQSDDERTARRMADDVWGGNFRQLPWDGLLSRWNAQPVFGPGPSLPRKEEDFDRGKLAAGMEEYSAGAQFTDPLRLPPRLVWLAGARDEKFCALLDDMRNAGFPGTFLRVDGSGHRLLQEAPDAVAAALDNLVA